MPRSASIPLARAVRVAFPLLLLLLGSLATPLRAAPTPPGSDTDRPASPAEAPPPETDESDAAARNRALAEKEYAKGYEDAEAAKKLAAEGTKDEAVKRFAKALERFEEAVRLHDAYADGWNMVGYCARQVGKMDRAFEAYDRALAIDPDHEEAHEYLGEAYLAVGDVAKAKEQLAWLREKESEEAEELAEKIEKAAADAGEKPEAAESPGASEKP